MMKVRASETPRFMQCSRYKHAALQIDSTSEAAAVGTATHRAIELILGGQDVKTAYQTALDSLDTSPENARIIWEMIHNAQAQLAELMGDDPDRWEVIPERKLAVNFPAGSPVTRLTGTPDLILWDPENRSVIIIDWKTNRDTSALDVEYADQLKSYALAWYARHPDTELFKVCASGLRDNVYYMDWVSPDDLRRHAVRLLKAAEDETYRIGGHCRYCRAQYSCPALRAKTTAAVATLQDERATVAGLIKSGKFAELWELRKIVENRLGIFKDAVREYIAENGPIEADGIEVYVNTIRKKQLDPFLAEEVLREYETDPVAIARCFKPSVTKIEAAVKQHARDKGEKIGATVSEFYEKLRARHVERNINMYQPEDRLTTRKRKAKK